MRFVSKVKYILRYLLFLKRVRRQGGFSHSPITKSGLIHMMGTITAIYRPSKIIQLGVGEGVGCIGLFLMSQIKGVKDVSIIGYDNFASRSVGETINKKIFLDNLKRYKADKAVALEQQNVLEIKCPYSEIDLLFVDIDNTYDKLMKLYELSWLDCVTEDGLIILEGGFSAHHNRDSSRGINNFCFFLQQKGFQTFTIRKYPGLVLVRKIAASDAAY